MKRLSTLVIGFYAWTLSLSCGMILSDILYAHLLSEELNANARQAIFTEATDFYLLLDGIAILAAIGAIAFSWRVSLARNLLIASLFLLIFKLIFPIFISQFISDAENLSFGPWVRIILASGASICALIGLMAGISHKKSGTLIARPQ